MKIIIFGASGAGTTTLGRSLAETLKWIHLDADDFYWEKTKIPFQIKVPQKVRNQNLRKDFELVENVIVSGSLVTWDSYWNGAFDLGVFLSLPHHVRMERLINREVERYGARLKSDIEIKKKHQAFLKWAEQYDDESFEGRSIAQHKEWIKLLKCKTIEIMGDLSNDERRKIVMEQIQKLHK
ncbi:AAA family ATPase [Fulvivirgaceae bacterium BMA12]|uniref:AAA family ATPase n=1 Tax=Agaribacillus aureus TaxID=3051825 RepID=A0ABT8LE63_9BACT|nr:AAA family ATPase [Fulvivirgaceae bacterium BMA12]